MSGKFDDQLRAAFDRMNAGKPVFTVDFDKDDRTAFWTSRPQRPQRPQPQGFYEVYRGIQRESDGTITLLMRKRPDGVWEMPR